LVLQLLPLTLGVEAVFFSGLAKVALQGGKLVSQGGEMFTHIFPGICRFLALPLSLGTDARPSGR
jgi:hypothetical protein